SRPVAVAADRADPGRADPDAARLAVLDLRLLLLGAWHVRPALGLPRAAARARGRSRPARDRRPSGREQGPSTAVPGEAGRDQARRAVGARAPGGGRLLVRGSCAVGLGVPEV